MPRAPRRCSRPDCDRPAPCPTHTPPPWAGRRRTFTRATRAVRTLVLERDPVCQCLGCPRCDTERGCSRPSTEDDHLKNVASGGSDGLANHAGKCGPCHRWKTQREATAGRS